MAEIFSLEYPQSLGVFDDYAQAQRAVDHLADEGFAVQNCLIVGTELRQVERVTGRLTTGRVLMAGAASGAWLGLLIGVLLGLFAGEGAWLVTVISAIGLGIVFGIVSGWLGYAATRGQRDFSSVQRIVATKYEVLVEHKLLAQGQQLLAQMPGRAADL